MVHSQTAFRFGKFRDGAPSLRRVLEALERIPWSGAQTNATRSLGTFPASSTIQRNLSLCNTRLAAAPQLPPETSKNNREQALHHRHKNTLCRSIPIARCGKKVCLC